MSILNIGRNARGLLRVLPLVSGLLSVPVVAETAAKIQTIVAVSSPKPEPVAAREAWRHAESFTAASSDCEVVVGSGGSMLPLYPDRTVLLIRRQPMTEWRAGMTVVFIGDSGRPVAHVLLHKAVRGWVAQGLANCEPDRTPVADRNYLGTVVRAFTPLLGGSSEMAGAPGAAGGQ